MSRPAFLDAHPQLKLLTTRSTSTDHLDLAALHARGVSVARVLHYGETTVAEHTFALILALSRRLREVMNLAQSKRSFSYEATRGFDLCGKDARRRRHGPRWPARRGNGPRLSR